MFIICEFCRMGRHEFCQLHVPATPEDPGGEKSCVCSHTPEPSDHEKAVWESGQQ